MKRQHRCLRWATNGLNSAKRRRGIVVLVLALAFALVPSSAFGSGPTNVSGTISADTTWTLENSPYVISSSVTVDSGVTLTIEPGVVVQGSSWYATLNVEGSLQAIGTESYPITFTSTSDSAPGQWNQIYFISGASTLDHVNVRNGGGNGVAMIYAVGGSLTVDHSTFSQSAGTGLEVFGGTNGTDASAEISRTKAEDNAGRGIFIFNAYAEIEDSASWSNEGNGISVWVASGTQADPTVVSGTSVWDNGGTGIQISQDSDVAALGPDGSENAVYDNGNFGFNSTDSWNQLTASRSSLDVDWRQNYWGPVAYVPCAYGSQNGHLSYGATNYNSTSSNPYYPNTYGPISSVLAYSGSNWGWNDSVLVNEPLYAQPDLYFNAPPPTFGGLLLEQMYGCLFCQLENPEMAGSLDRPGKTPVAYSSQPVSTASGSLTETATDLRMNGPGIPFTWTRSYNSADTSTGRLGKGWTDPFGASLTLINPTTGELDYESGSGQHTRFSRVKGSSSGSATYEGKGFDGTLKRLSDNSYQLTSRDQRVFNFDSSGKLTQIKPRFLPATTLTYSSGKLSSVTDSAGRSIAIAYSTSDPTLIESVTLPDNRYVQYGYTDGLLTSVRDARGKTWTFDYDGNDRLTTIEDPVGHYKLQDVEYDGQGRVTSEENGTGDETTYAYTTSAPYDVTTMTVPERGDWVYKHIGNMLMSVTDPLDRTTVYRYDAMARLASVKDPRGFTSRTEYDAYGNIVKEISPEQLGTVTRTFNSTNDLLTETDGRGNSTTYVYATSSGPASDYQVGQLKTITDRENGVTTPKYWTTTSSPTPPATNVGLLKSTTNARGKVTSYNYDSSGNLTKVTSPLGLKTTYTYDSSGRLTSSRDPRGNIPDPPSGYLTQWTYDAADHAETLTDARGNVTSFDYYDNGLLWKVTKTESDETPRVTTYAYDDANRLSTTTDPRDGVETRLYWPDGQLESVESAEGRTTSYDYDDAGQLTTLVEPNGNAEGATASDWTWTYGYDDAGNLTSQSHPDGGTTHVAYDALNRPDEWIDALENTTSVDYNANSDVVTRTDGLDNSKTYAYDKLDRLASETDELDKTTTYTYFATGELASTTTPLGHETTYGLDNDGRTTSMVDPRGNEGGANPAEYTWAYQYDAAGNRSRVTDPLSNYTQYVYDAVNNVTQVTDQRGNATDLAYDTMNRLTSVTPPAAGGTGTLATAYTYDANGNLASRTDPKDHVTSWVYDLDNYLTERTTPVGTWNQAYDENGNLTSVETPLGSSTQTPGDGTISYGYDRMSRQTGADYSDATPDVSRTYDAAGRLETMTDGSGVVAYSYDDANRLTDVTRTNGGSGLNGTFHYDYDDAGDITGRTYPDNTGISSGFDDDGRLTSVSSGGQTVGFAYDAAGKVTATTLPSGNGYSETRTYDRAGRLTNVDNAKSGTSLSAFALTLDSAGNPTKIQTTRGGTSTYAAYEYDARERLTASCFGVAQGVSNCSGAANEISYAYDKVSNRTQEVRTGSVGNTGTIDYAYNASDQLTSTTKGGQDTDYSYDANGNEASAGSRTFTYDLANELVSTTLSQITTTYAYDGDGKRTASDTTGGAQIRYIWDPLAESGIPELALEQTPNGALIRRYADGPLGAVSVTDSSGDFYYHHDPLGNVTDVTDEDGSAQWLYTYEGFGAGLSASDVSGTAPVNPLQYEGQYLDSGTGLYDLRARQYDPVTGRFAALDPLESPIGSPYDGAYVYVNGRPMVLVDPLGLSGCMFCDWAWDRTKAGGGALKDVVTGKAERKLGAAFYDAYAAAGGGPKGMASAFAYTLTAPFFACYDAIARGNPSAISSNCGQAAALLAGAKFGRLRCAEVSPGGLAVSGEVVGAANRVWRVGDAVDALTAAGTKPAWSTVRARYWKNFATNASEREWGAGNIERMRRGLAPKNAKGESMHLHHVTPRSKGGGDHLENLQRLWPDEHYDAHRNGG